MRYAQPGTEGSIVSFKSQYGNYIGGEFVAPVKGQYFTNTSPVNGKPIAQFPRSTAEDIEKALDAAHAAADAWGATSVQARSLVLLEIADRIVRCAAPRPSMRRTMSVIYGHIAGRGAPGWPTPRAGSA